MFQGFLNLQTFAMGTAYQANTTQQSAFALVMNGSEWMVYSNSSGSPLWDYSVTGRSLSRPGAATDIAVNLKQLVNATSNWSTGSEFAKIVKSIQTPSHDANHGPFNGNKMFYYGDYMVHRRSNYIVTLKMTSNRTLAEECVNGESSKGFHLSDGTLYTYLSGDEYRNIFPTWDWDLIPGTTIDYRGTPNNCTPAYLGSNAFAGGVSNGQIGVAGLNYKNPKTKDFSWKKSWFFLNDFYVVLGSNISETRPNPVFSTLDQRKLNGKVYIGNDHRPATTGLYKDVKWIHHDSIGYQMLEGKVSVNLSTSVQSGTWQSIGAYNGSVSLPVFNAKIVHQQTSGQAVQNAELGYVVYPGMSRSKFISHTRHSPVSVLQRNDVAHIIQIESETFVGAVFWSAGNASIPLFSKVRSTVVVSSGIVFSALTGSNSVQLMVADPTQMLSSVQLTVDTRGKSLHCPKNTAFSCSVKSSSTTVITVSLPQGATAGSTVQGEFKIGGSFNHSWYHWKSIHLHYTIFDLYCWRITRWHTKAAEFMIWIFEAIRHCTYVRLRFIYTIGVCVASEVKFLLAVEPRGHLSVLVGLQLLLLWYQSPLRYYHSCIMLDVKRCLFSSISHVASSFHFAWLQRLPRSVWLVQ